MRRELCSFVDLCGNRKELYIRARISHWNAGLRCSFFHILESLQLILEFFIFCALHALLILTSRFPFDQMKCFQMFLISSQLYFVSIRFFQNGKIRSFLSASYYCVKIVWILIKSFGLQMPSLNCVVFASEHTRSILYVSKQNRQPLIGFFTVRQKVPVPSSTAAVNFAASGWEEFPKSHWLPRCHDRHWIGTKHAPERPYLWTHHARWLAQFTDAYSRTFCWRYASVLPRSHVFVSYCFRGL